MGGGVLWGRGSALLDKYLGGRALGDSLCEAGLRSQDTEEASQTGIDGIERELQLDR